MKQADGWFCKCGVAVLVADYTTVDEAHIAFCEQHAQGPWAEHHAIWIEQWKPRSQATQLPLPTPAEATP